MTPEAINVRESGIVKMTAAVALSAGDIVRLADGRAGVVLGGGESTHPIGASVSIATSGTWKVASASGTTFAAGDPVFWDDSADLAISAPGDALDAYLGTALFAKSSGQTRVEVDFDSKLRGMGASGNAVMFTTREHELDHADAAAVNMLDATENPTGMILFAVFGRISEVMAGGDEDQMIVTFRDSDANALSTITVSDAGADALGDIIVGTQSVVGSSTGGVLKTVPAGKGLEAIITQATSGAGVAGKMKVRAILCPLL